MRQWPSGAHTKRLSADGILSALANRTSLTLPLAGTTPFTRPTSEGPDLKTSPLGDKLYTYCGLRTVPENTPIELSLGDTDSKRLCPALTNFSPSPLEINGGRRSNCTVISAKKGEEKRLENELRSTGATLTWQRILSFASRTKAQRATWN